MTKLAINDKKIRYSTIIDNNNNKEKRLNDNYIY